jgi:argininosuccinate lyase
VADYLVGKGIPFREAHEIVAGLVRRLLDEGREFSSLSDAEWKAVNPAFGPDVHEAIKPERAVAAKRSPQSTNPEQVRAQLAELDAWIVKNP